MDIDWLGLVLRWLHILAAITAVGGTIFMRLALLPAASTLDAAQRQALFASLRPRWSKMIMGAIGFLLISGLWNFILINQSFKQADVKIPALYQPLFGVKFLLALGIFGIASVLAGRSAATEKFRQNAKYWMSVNLILATLVVCISGVLRSTHVAPNAPPATKTLQTAGPAN
jgi:uncharacterized membrane protein